ncbi:MAG: SAM-dependent methyltransferase [Woeseiaceae bacterium]|nr:SAM-dependent methyltransferase [Woeseiaceae bacterium]MDX2607432.1 SAM-dependent methyltransferase [Woeseiaceae bacterium]
MQYEQHTSLPEVDPESAQHSARVAQYVRDKIAAAGACISFAEYMHHVLYAPGLGYYSAGTTKFGAAGDFVTAPEVSSVFGSVLARQCAEVLAQVDAASILEFGAGSGKLAADILRKLSELGAVPDRYSILEVSADLRERQESFLRDEIPEFADRVVWLDQLPEEHSGVIVANEVLDALPVERFVRRVGRVMQICVAVGGEAFSLVERDAPESLATAVAAIESDLGQPLPDGYTSDICLASAAWVADLASILAKGAVFLFDYGVSRREYYADERSDGWLRCHFRHHAHDDPLILPGIQDLTSWVDFTAAAEAAVAAGLDILGFSTQAQFLIGGGLEQELADFAELPIDAQLKLSGQVKLLTLPGEMGENFKCLGLGRGDIIVPAAFNSADRTMSL